MSTETIDQLRETKQELLEELIRVKKLNEGLKELNQEISEELQEVKDWWVEAANERDQLKRDLIAAPVRFTEKTRKRNESNPQSVRIWNNGKNGKRERCFNITDESTIENKTSSAFLEVVVETGRERIRLNRNGVAELRNELQRILDFNPTAR
jgi:hypothetical protein